MRNIRRFLRIVTLAILVFPAGTFVLPAQANDVTLYGGVQNPGSINLGTAVEQGVQFAFKPGNFGVFGIRSSRGAVLGNEHTLAFASNFLDTRSKALFLNTNVIVHAPLGAARPYITGGLGAMHTFGDGLGDLGTKFALNYGGGLKLSVAGPVGGRLDVRGYTIPGVHNQTLNVLEVSLGVVFSY
jgi:hypothetical protein